MADPVLDGLIDDVRRARDRARSRAGSAHRLSFGARDLLIYSATDIDTIIPAGALRVATSAHQRAVAVHILTRAEAEAVRMPDERGAPYGAVRASEQTDWLILRSPESGRLLAFDRRDGDAVYFPGDAHPPREQAEFCRPLLHWLAIRDGGVVVHAGAIERDGCTLLVAGTGNAGKSTLIRACLNDGFRMLGDNVVEVTPGPHGTPMALGVYPTVKVRPAPVIPIADHWPAPLWDDEAAKDIYLLADTLGDAFAHGPLPIVGALVLDEHAPARPRRLSAGEALFRVAPNTVGQFPLFEQQVLTRIGALLRGLAVTGAGRIPVNTIADVVRDVIRDSAAAEIGVRG